MRDVCCCIQPAGIVIKYIQGTNVGVSMLFMNGSFAYVCKAGLLLMLLMGACAGYAYYVNTQRPADDPKKRNYRFGAIVLAPFTWLIFLLASVTIFILRVFVYMAFLVLFTIAFIALRKPFLLIWLDKIATKIGNKLLEANTLLIKVVFGKKIDAPPTP